MITLVKRVKRIFAGSRAPVIALALLAAELTLAAALLLIRARGAVEAEVGRRAMGVALAAAQGLDVDRYRALAQSGNVRDPYFLEIQARWQALRQNQQAAYIYSEERVGLNAIRYVLDADGPGDRHSPGAFQQDVMDATSERAHTTGQPLYGPLVHHPVWGGMITGYAPIRDRAGRLLGVVGVDFGPPALAPLYAALHWAVAAAAAAGAAAGAVATAAWMRWRLAAPARR